MKNLTKNKTFKIAVSAVGVLLLLGLGLLAAHQSGRFYDQEMALKGFMERVPGLNVLAKNIKPKLKVAGAEDVFGLDADVEFLNERVKKVEETIQSVKEVRDELKTVIAAQQRRDNNNAEVLATIAGKVESKLNRLDEEMIKLRKSVPAKTQKADPQIAALRKEIQGLKTQIAKGAKKSEQEIARIGASYKRLARVYADMDADVIAEIFQDKTLKESQVVELMTRLPKDKVSEVLAAMDATTAAAYTKLLAEKN